MTIRFAGLQRGLAWLVAAAGCLAGSGAFASVIYTYTGNAFTSATAPYTTSNSVSGWFEMSSPLGPGVTMANPVTPVAFSFTDGVNTLTESSTTPSSTYFYFATDAGGSITDWVINLTYLVDGPGGVERTIYTHNDTARGFFPDPLTEDGALSTVCATDSPPAGCSSSGPGGSSGSAQVGNSPGSWSVRDTNANVPEPGALALLGLGLLALGATRRRRA